MREQPFQAKQILEAVHARDIAHPAGPNIDVASSIKDTFETMFEEAEDYNPFDRPSLVISGSKVEGIVWQEDLDADRKLVTDVTTRYGTPMFCQGSAASVEVLLAMYRAQASLAILGPMQRPSGIITPYCFWNPSFRMGILAMLLHLEQRWLSILHRSPEESWRLLSEDVQGQKEHEFTSRHRRAGKPNDLLSMLSFTQKLKLVQEVSPDTLKGFTTSIRNQVIKLRNACAHPEERVASSLMPESEWIPVLGRIAELAVSDLF